MVAANSTALRRVEIIMIKVKEPRFGVTNAYVKIITA